MAKIKSTLDLVMERTKSMHMTDEEKQALKEKEWTDRVRGWVQKLIDRKMTLSEMKSVLSEEEKHSEGVRAILQRELIDHIDPDGENEQVIDALRTTLGLEVSHSQQVLDTYTETMRKQSDVHRDRVRKELENRGISGSSVLPNLSKNTEWLEYRKRLKEDALREIEESIGI
ncbi:MAG: hypothetical protein ACP5G0_10695 [Desulfomonilia bacterium]